MTSPQAFPSHSEFLLRSLPIPELPCLVGLSPPQVPPVRPVVICWHTDWDTVVLNPSLLTSCSSSSWVISSSCPLSEAATISHEVKSNSFSREALFTANSLIETHIISSDLSAASSSFHIASCSLRCSSSPGHDL